MEVVQQIRGKEFANVWMQDRRMFVERKSKMQDTWSSV